MQDQGVGRGIATIAIWGGIAGLTHILGKMHLLSGQGVGWIICAAVVTTIGVWESHKITSSTKGDKEISCRCRHSYCKCQTKRDALRRKFGDVGRND